MWLPTTSTTLHFNIDHIDLYSIVQWIRQFDRPVSDDAFNAFVLQVYSLAHKPLPEIFLNTLTEETLIAANTIHPMTTFEHASNYVKFHMELSKDAPDIALLFR